MASGVVAFGLFKKQPWPRQRIMLYSFATAFMSHDIGEVGVWSLRRKWLQSLENQRGFKNSMNNIEARLKKEQTDTMQILNRPIPQYSRLPDPPSTSNSEQSHEEQSSQWNWQDGRDDSPSQSTTNKPATSCSYQFLQAIYSHKGFRFEGWR